MPFDYYEHLSRPQQATYRRSDAVGAVPLPDAAALAPAVQAMGAALEADDRASLQRTVSSFTAGLMKMVGAGPVDVEVLDRRPSSAESELHGLYTREADGSARIQVWMRTAANGRPAAHRTFVRTLLHECCHHLDFELLQLEDTFHTQGFFRRESSLVRQLLPEPGPRAPKPPKEPKPARDKPAQLDLFAPPKPRRG